MTADNRTNKYAGFLARQNHQRDPWRGVGAKCLCGKVFDLDADHAMHQVDEILRAALVAAQGATTEELAKIKPLFENLSREYPNECNKRVKAEAERDAALAAVERVRDLANSLRGRYADNSDAAYFTKQFLAALDGAPEPEVEREYRRVRPDGVPVFNAVFETMPLLDDYYTAEYRTVSPWLPVEGEMNGDS